ncbi:FtsX-like permease family protein [Roseicitreum antarcticum]|uniref:Putative ABC transport system permease protein n=1 Tax=Roseicitreum antarcticum TaxID=564137 RepID=A0A1H2U2X1_9RHOB|nr:FtsX-like permease family protein [Roseicitreum antarcticum]SDW50248.1 putative ABC transport system permease protein [Roseicitreum antarcticum]
MTRAALAALLSHWRAHPLQVVTLLIGLALSTALWSGVQALNAEARASYARAADLLGTGQLDRLTRDGGPVTQAQYVALRRAGWQVSPVLEGRMTLGAARVTITGTEPLTAPAQMGPGSGDGLAGLLAGADGADTPDLTAFITPPGIGFAAPETLDRIGALSATLEPARLGDDTARTDGAGDGRKVPQPADRPREGPQAAPEPRSDTRTDDTQSGTGTPSAALPRLLARAGLPPGTVLTDIGIAQRLLGRPGQIGYLLIAPDQPLGLPPLARISPELRRIPADSGTDMVSLTDSFHLNLTAFGFLAFAVGLLIVHSAVGLAYAQRRPMLRTLRALGVPLRRLMALLMAELLVLTLVAGGAGLVLGYLIAGALLPDVAATLSGLYGAQVAQSLSVSPLWLASGLGMALAGAALASGWAIWKIARLPLLAGAQPRAWAAASGGALALQGAAAGALALLAGGLALWGNGLIAGFALLAAMLLAAALALPLALRAVLVGLARGARGPVAAWVWADSRAQLPSLSVALMALMLALAANVGVGTMVSGFRLTFTGWLDQRLAAELYVTAQTDAQAVELRDWLTPRVQAVLPVRSTDVTLFGAPAQINGVADDATYRDHWPVLQSLPDVWARLALGEGVLVNEQLARRQSLWPGATLAVPGLRVPGSENNRQTTGQATGQASLQPAQMTVLGVYSDYGNPRAQVIVTDALFNRAFPDAPARQFALRLDPAGTEQLAAALRDRFDLPASAVVDQAQIKALSLRVFEQTFTVTRALNVLTLAVAAAALFAGLLTLAGQRQGQIAPLWAMGLTRRRLAALDFGRTLALAALTAVLALPVGLLLAWVLLTVINVQAFGWRLPMHLFPGDWLRLGLWALLAAGAAALIPAWQLARARPVDLLKVFANER